MSAIPRTQDTTSPREKAAMQLANALVRLDALEDEKAEWMAGYRQEKQELLRVIKDLRQEIISGQAKLFENN